MDSEYQSLMKELGEKVPESSSGGSLFTGGSLFGSPSINPNRGMGTAVPPPAPLVSTAWETSL